MYKNKLILSSLAMLFAFLALALLCYEANSSDVFRLHVIANSDSASDQRIKLLVRDEVLSSGAALADAASARDTKDYVLNNGQALLDAANAILRREGADYGAQLVMGRFDFPSRSYGNATLPEGEYDALRIVLGDGEGQNWWCVMYPPLCLSEPVEEGKRVIFKSWVAEKLEEWRMSDEA